MNKDNINKKVNNSTDFQHAYQHNYQNNNQNNSKNNFQDNKQKPVDVRVIVEGPEKSEFFSKAIKNIDLFNDFNIIISSIITTNNVEIAKNAIIGSDIVLIATSSDDEGKSLFSNFYNSLKTDFNYVEFLNFPKLRDIEITDIKNVENEIKNSIIRAGLTSIFDIANINQLRSELLEINDNFDQSQAENEKIALENEMLIKEAKQVQEKNDELSNEIKELQEHIDEVKLDFTNFKSRYSNIHTRNILEIFPVTELWIEVFNEVLNDDEIDKVVIATNKFKPDNVLIGQDYIGANSKKDAIDWLKIVKTALIFVENDNNELQEEMVNYYKKKHSYEVDNNYNNYSNHNNPNNKSNNNYTYKDQNNNQNNNKYITQNKDNYNESDNEYNHRYDDLHLYKKNNRSNKSNYHYEEEDYDYDITNQFQNFWD